MYICLYMLLAHPGKQISTPAHQNLTFTDRLLWGPVALGPQRVSPAPCSPSSGSCVRGSHRGKERRVYTARPGEGEEPPRPLSSPGNTRAHAHWITPPSFHKLS